MSPFECRTDTILVFYRHFVKRNLPMCPAEPLEALRQYLGLPLLKMAVISIGCGGSCTLIYSQAEIAYGTLIRPIHTDGKRPWRN